LHELVEHDFHGGHDRPQLPQLFRSEVVSTHEPAHSVLPPVQVLEQVPDEQTSRVVHAWPHVPQLSWSVLRFLQTPVQSVSPVGQVQLLDTHVFGALHDRPQPPQFALSLLVSTHEVPQVVFGGGQVVVHAPEEQSFGDAQGTPQPPQLAGSVLVSTHFPAQSVLPPVHAQDPDTHVSSERQIVPQPPQFVPSDLVSTQEPPQSVRPVPHVDEQWPEEHTSLPVHAVPHAPQLSWLDFVSTHVPLQSVSVEPH
jgi:hypothetical protein